MHSPLVAPLAEATENGVNLSMPEKIILVAYELEEQGLSPFTAEMLIVAAWQKYPQAFGLRGYTDQHPDSNKVITSIVGERGLVRRGWLSKPAPKLYGLTRDGRRLAERFRRESEPSRTFRPAKVKITREPKTR